MAVEVAWILFKLILADPRRGPALLKAAKRVSGMTPTALRLASAMYEAQRTKDLSLRAVRLERLKAMDTKVWKRLLASDRDKVSDAAKRMKGIRDDARWLRDESLRIGVDLGQTFLEE